MSSTLFVRHLSNKLSVSEREDFLKHFGAEKVWFINPNSYTAFASFRTEEQAKQALFRLHQQELLGKRLTVEYSKEANSSHSSVNEDKNESKCLSRFLENLNSWNSSVDFLQPPPPCLKYKYPPAAPNILYNIMYALQTNTSFYVQTLHLMNKMCLDPPFGEVSEIVKTYIRDTLKELNIEIKLHQDPIETTISIPVESSEESEISSSEEPPLYSEPMFQPPTKRKSTLKRINKIPKLATQLRITHTEKKKTPVLNTKDVFEEIPVHEVKKIELKVNKTQVIGKQSDESIVEIGTIGKVYPQPLDNRKETKSIEDSEENNSFLNKIPVITRKELLDNKISYKDMQSLPIFKNYHPGVPSMRLYIKNLSKDVELMDLECIYKPYIADCDFKEVEMFNIRVMQEGRMKGQAFVTFPSVELCERALNETNGFILKNKPMVVQFARTAK